MKVEIKNLRRGQVIYDEDLDDRYKVYSNPEFKNGKWQVEVTTKYDGKIYKVPSDLMGLSR